MRKRFIHVTPTVRQIPDAYKPLGPTTPRVTGIQWYLAEIRRALCELAHATLRRWGRPVLDYDELVKTVQLDSVGDILERVRAELDNRVRTYRVRPDELGLIVGMRAREDLHRALYSCPGAAYPGSAEHYYRNDPDGLTYAFGMPVIVTPWLEEDEMILLPIDYLRHLARVGVTKRPVRAWRER